MSDIRQVRRAAIADVAWKDATDPALSVAISSSLRVPHQPATYDYVAKELGATAAVEWQRAVDARRAFFEAVNDKEPSE